MLAVRQGPHSRASPALGDPSFDETSQRRRQEHRVLVEGEVGARVVLVELIGGQVDDAGDRQPVEADQGASDADVQGQ